MECKIPFGNRCGTSRKVVLHHTHLIDDIEGLIEDGDMLFLDDALYSQYTWFYQNVYELMRKHVVVVLGISTDCVRSLEVAPRPIEKSAILHDRFHKYIGKDAIMAEKARDGFMSWKEIGRMLEFPFVYPANHGHNHLNLREMGKDLTTLIGMFMKDISVSQEILELHGMDTDIFVFPYDIDPPGTRQWLKTNGFRYIFGGTLSDRIEIEDLAAKRRGGNG